MNDDGRSGLLLTFWLSIAGVAATIAVGLFPEATATGAALIWRVADSVVGLLVVIAIVLAIVTLRASVPASQPAPVGSETDAYVTRPPTARRTRRVQFAAIPLVTVAGLLVGFFVAQAHQPSAGADAATTNVTHTFPLRSYADGISSARSWHLTGRSGMQFAETVKVRNTTAIAVLVTFIEPVPTAITSSLNTVRFSPEPKILLGQRVAWRLRLPPGGVAHIGYQTRVAATGLSQHRLAEWAIGFDKLPVTVRAVPESLKSLAITPGHLRITAGGHARLALSGRLRNGKSVPAEFLSGCVWRSASPRTATVTCAGVVIGRAPGRTTMTARLGSVSYSIRVVVSQRVTPGPAQSSHTSPPQPAATPSAKPSPTTTVSPI